MEFLNINQMILIGSTGRNSGKTTLAVELIKKWKSHFPVIALKITTIQDRSGKCQRGGEGCGVCTNIKEDFKLVEEGNKDSSKDTSLLLAAGAEKVYWLRCLKDHIHEGIEFFMRQVPDNALIICESNTLRTAVVPGTFIMLKNTENDAIKKSAGEVINKADIIIENDFQNSIKNIVEKIEVKEEKSQFQMKIHS